MASVISTNNASLVAQRNLGSSQTSLTTSVQRLSSGMRIHSAMDDAAGLGISQQLQAQATGARVSARNANDAISMAQTAEGGLQEVSSMLQRMRELATQGNNDSLDTTQRGYIATEIDALRSEINQVVERTTFNGKTLLDGSVSGLNLAQVGTAASADYAPATVGKATFANYVSDSNRFIAVDVGSNYFNLGTRDTTGASVASDFNAQAGFSSVAIATFTNGDLVITGLAKGSAARVLANHATMGTAVSTGATDQVGTAASADFVAASVTAGSGLAFQLGASASADAQDIGALFTNAGIGSAASGSSFSALDTAITQVVGGATSAEMGTLTAAIDDAVGAVAGMRAKLGAMNNRLGHNIANLQTQQESLSASMSRITDADYAAETATLSKDQVMQQAATAMLAQANQMPNAVLSLLQ